MTSLRLLCILCETKIVCVRQKYVLMSKTHLRGVVETPWYDVSTFAVVSRECLRLLYIIWCICQSPLQGAVRFF